KMAAHLSAELVAFIKSAGQLAQGRGEKLYLVGGIVRDLLLKKANLDVDLVVEGNAKDLAGQLIADEPPKITIHRRFNTAKISWHKWSIDIAAARSESYPRPGALPTVSPGTLKNDLMRRDFSINAMAVVLNPDGYGELIDPCGGQKDLELKLIRILHDKSFTDDATRIWRGLRYEQRLGFKLEANTLRLLKRDTAMLNAISGDRIRYELECILQEEYPEKVLARAQELGALKKLHPSLKGNSWLEAKFSQARRFCSPDRPPLGLYMALLAYRLSEAEKEQLISMLRLTKLATRTLRDSGSLKDELKLLADTRLKPSRVYQKLHGYIAAAVTANLIASESSVIQEHLKLFLDKLRYIKPALNGNDLQKMGIATGPRIKEILNRLRQARLDGGVTSKKDEERLVREWLAG
ncbi:MAG: CCA tRNA nucleotidyltransferase, partial [Dehalococcoidales bacterium]